MSEPIVFANLVSQYGTANGTGTFALGARTDPKYSTMDEKIAVGSLVGYVARQGLLAEEGYGLLQSSTQLTRIAAFDSSGTGIANNVDPGSPSLVSFDPTTSVTIYSAVPARLFVSLDASGNPTDPSPFRNALFVQSIAEMKAEQGLSSDEALIVAGNGIFYFDPADATAPDNKDTFRPDNYPGALFKRMRLDIQGAFLGSATVDAAASGTGAYQRLYANPLSGAPNDYFEWNVNTTSSSLDLIGRLNQSARVTLAKFYSLGTAADRVEFGAPMVVSTKANANGFKAKTVAFLSGVSHLVMAWADAADNTTEAAYREIPLTKGGYIHSDLLDVYALTQLDPVAAGFPDDARVIVHGTNTSSGSSISTNSGNALPRVYYWQGASGATSNNNDVVRPAVGAAATGNGRWLILASDITKTATSGVATPSVKGVEWLFTAGSTAITNFPDGVEGQILIVYRGNADIVIAHDPTKIRLTGQENKSLVLTSPCMVLRYHGGVWYESGSSTPSLRYDISQAFSAAQMAQIRANLRNANYIQADDFDGTDDQKFQAALDAARTWMSTTGLSCVIILSPRWWNFSTSLNGTNINPNSSAPFYVLAFGASCRFLATGKVGLDLIKSSCFHFFGGLWYGDFTNTPKNIILHGRDSALTQVGQASFNHMYFSGYAAGALEHNLGSETVSYNHVSFFNSKTGYPTRITDGAAHFGATSDYQTLPTTDVAYSCTGHTFTSCDIRGAVGSTESLEKFIHATEIKRTNCYKAGSSTYLTEIRTYSAGVTPGPDWDIIGYRLDEHCESAGTYDYTVGILPGVGSNTAIKSRIFEMIDAAPFAKLGMFYIDPSLAVSMSDVKIQIGVFIGSMTNGICNAASNLKITGNISLPKLVIGNLARFSGSIFVDDYTVGTGTLCVGSYVVNDFTNSPMMKGSLVNRTYEGYAGTISGMSAGVFYTSDGTTHAGTYNFTGTGPAYGAGVIYSDTNWGMLFRGLNATPGSGEYVFISGDGTNLMVADKTNFRPASSGLLTLGTASLPWGQIYSTSLTISTSDANLKTEVVLDEDTSEKLSRVAVKLKSQLRCYQMNDAIELKGDDARIHFGIFAQDVLAAFEAEGLDGLRYGIYCEDEIFEDIYETTSTTDEAGKVTEALAIVGRESRGIRRSVRYTELSMFLLKFT